MVLRSKYGAQIIITPTYIMPPKPTCKVVKREGQRGARIDPKGCKVRTTKDAQGNKRQYNKQGQEKFKICLCRPAFLSPAADSAGSNLSQMDLICLLHVTP